jgi:hypothetical protein
MTVSQLTLYNGPAARSPGEAKAVSACDWAAAMQARCHHGAAAREKRRGCVGGRSLQSPRRHQGCPRHSGLSPMTGFHGVLQLALNRLQPRPLGTATVSVAPVGVSPTESGRRTVQPRANPFRTTRRFWAFTCAFRSCPSPQARKLANQIKR